jgi:hypothetical protein
VYIFSVPNGVSVFSWYVIPKPEKMYQSQQKMY